jgi:hypothetical protein
MAKKIPFHFHPYNFEKNGHTVTKSEQGETRRYLIGVSSGLVEDAHKDRMSKRCVESFLEQMNAKDILLYPDKHEIEDSNDIGILSYGDILKNGDWYTEYRVHEESDGIGMQKTEKIENIWKRIKGLPPYTKPKQKGFSIEGIIYEKDIIKDELGKQVLDYVDLDGVILVPRPAYIHSMANAVFKALGELPTWEAEKIKTDTQGKLHDIVQQQELHNAYWDKKYSLNGALQELITNIMSDQRELKSDRLQLVFNEYRDSMIDLLLASKDLFLDDSKDSEYINKKDKIFNELASNLSQLSQKIKGRL